MRLVCWFSCGVTSAVATKLALDMFPDLEPHVVYHDTHSEHPYNERFLADCEQWYGVPIERVNSTKYHDIWDVFESSRFIVNRYFAKCTVELKRIPGKRYVQDGDVQVFGFEPKEAHRVHRFRINNPDMTLATPLLNAGYDKARCFELLASAHIDIPPMYRLGYGHNNCLGCPKGGMGYWNMIRRDFPGVYERMARLERSLDVAINKSYAGDGLRKRVFLDELDPNAGRGYVEPMSCGLFCQDADDG